MWKVSPVPERSRHQGLDPGTTRSSPHRPEPDFAILCEQLRVRVEVADVEVLAVIDEQLADRLEIFQSGKSPFDRFRRRGATTATAASSPAR